MEVWKPVVGAEGLYEVSDQGRVRSLDRKVRYVNGRTARYKGRLLRPFRSPRMVKVCLGRGVNRTVHSLVACAFLGSPPINSEICHNDGNAANNRLENLRYDTRIANAADKRRHGTHLEGSRCPHAKLNEKEVLEIRRLYNSGSPQNSLAYRFGVTKQAIHRLIHRRTWRHV